MELKPPYHYDRLVDVPPRMTTEEAAAFINWSMHHANPDHVRRQKELEEQIEKRFYFPEVGRPEGG